MATASVLTLTAMTVHAAPGHVSDDGTVLQTNLVSDLPGVAAVTDPNLVNPWGISESSASPFWFSDNNSGLSTLYQVPGTSPAPVTVNPLVVNIPTPVATTGGAPTGTVFNSASGAFMVSGLNKSGQTASAAAAFLFSTEDGTILGWNPGIDPTGKFAGSGGVSGQATIAVDNSGNNFTNPDPNQQTGAVYKGLAIATSSTPIIAADAASTALLYASNFRAGTVEVYDANFHKVTTLAPGAFRDKYLPRGYAPFGIQVLNGKVYVTYAKQDATKHDDAAGPGRGFVDVFNLDGTPGLPGGRVRLVSGGPLDSPWGLAIAPAGFGGITAPGSDPVLLVGNFGDGFIHAFDAATGVALGQLRDPAGRPIQIDGLWALQVGNGGKGGVASAVYFTAGPFGESHGLFGSLTTAAPGSAAGPAEGQWVQANLDVVQADLQRLNQDQASGATAATIAQDKKTLTADFGQLARAEHALTTGH
ncbi:MAG TPA: TIGR03118 family protein [Trebonia sp.]|nr:TIGR03118 family protein [Trebonia sp.]